MPISTLYNKFCTVEVYAVVRAEFQGAETDFVGEAMCAVFLRESGRI